MNYVLDASAAFEIAFNRPRAEFYKKTVSEAQKVIAPHFFINEVTNVLYKYVRGGYLDEQNAQLTLSFILQLVDEYIDSEENAVESLHEAIHLNHPAYDMFYLTLARRNAAVLLTEDERLKTLCKAQGVAVAGSIDGL